MNGGVTYASDGGVGGQERFAGYTWNGVGNHVFNNGNRKNISLHITDYDASNPNVGDQLYITFSRVGFNNGSLGWGNDMVTDLLTVTSSEFVAGEAIVTVDIPAGTVPVDQTAGYENGYLWVLQIVGSNADGNTYINYVVDIEEEILNAKSFNKNKLSAIYNASTEAIVINDINIVGDYAIYDLTGRSVLNGVISNKISVATLNSGLYILSTESGTLKFVK
ncbi:T9SS type A sorting domain-containing protein [Pseudotamlana carrageenivorans]|nr:T9SS type A sorting domain-containing protein [Tamlana carrageenivorans]